MRNLILVMLLVPITAFGANVAPQKDIKNKELLRLVFYLEGVAGVTCLSKEVASSFEVPQHWECHLDEVPKDDVTDGMDHNATLLVETSTSATEQGPRRLLFNTIKSAPDKKSGEAHTFVVSLEGELIKALATYGKYNEKGEAVKGSGIDVPQDIKSKEIRSRLKHELEFWIDGKYRKKPVKGAKAPAGESKAEFGRAGSGARPAGP